MMRAFQTPLAYRVISSLAALILPFWLRKRIRDGKEDASRIRERYGRTKTPRPTGELIWLHGASVGETQMLRPLIARLLEKPGRHVLITSGTKTSADLLATQLPDRAIHQYLPADTPRATARFIAYWRPDLVIFAESELWPNLIWTAKRAKVPLALVNARMSEASLEGWMSRLPMAESVIGAFDTILAADRRTADGLARITMGFVPDVGNLKLDAPALGYESEEREVLCQAIGERPVWLAASTHEAEEDVFRRLQAAVPDAFMIWLPRHPSRGPALAESLNAPLRSRGDRPTARSNIYVMDTIGEMGLALSLARVCVLGGSFHPSLMGHNPLEAARAGVPVLSGPFHASFVDLFREMVAADAIHVTPERETAALIRDGLDGRLKETAQNALTFSANQSGALSRTVAELEALL